MSAGRLGGVILSLLIGFHAESAFADCFHVKDFDPALKIDGAVVAAMKSAQLDDKDFYRVVKIVASYETGGCWAGATGNFDGQWLSVGVRQWNLGQRSLQPILKAFMLKFASDALLAKELERLMPQYGRSLFDPSCRAIPVGPSCRRFLQTQYSGEDHTLQQAFKAEVDRLFESDVMRQIQVDYFARALTTVLDDLGRVFSQRAPGGWQVAWAMDLKTQQGRFPKDDQIRRVRKELPSLQPEARQERLFNIVKWYGDLCQLYSDGVSGDCKYNTTTWEDEIRKNVPPDREETVHFTFLVSRSAGGEYQADAFQRRATIAFGKGSVHGTKIDFSTF